MTTESTAFEQLVARIEERLAGTDAEVTSPERIRGRHTKTLRECDATIRVGAGSTRLLVLIECRKRAGTQGSPWIEQLVTKADDVAADRVIAVSATPFSEGARNLAELHRIELRQVDEVTGDDIDHWCRHAMFVTMMTTDWETGKWAVEFYLSDDDTDRREISEEHIARVSAEEDAPILFRRGTDESISIRDLLANAGDGLEEGLEPNGPALDKTFRATFPPAYAYMPTTRGNTDVKSIHIALRVRMLKETRLADRFVRYYTPGGETHTEHAEYDFDVGHDMTSTLRVDFPPEGGEKSDK